MESGESNKHKQPKLSKGVRQQGESREIPSYFEWNKEQGRHVLKDGFYYGHNGRIYDSEGTLVAGKEPTIWKKKDPRRRSSLT